MEREPTYDDLSSEEKSSYLRAAQWCAENDIRGVCDDPLPDGLTVKTVEVIICNREAFADEVRSTAYMLAMEEMEQSRHGE